MLFNSVDFIIFFPIVVIIFCIVPKKLRQYWLLIASYYFYMSWNPKYAVLMAVSTVITYSCGLLIQKVNISNCKAAAKKKKAILTLSIISNLLILAAFKYANFVLLNLSTVSSHLGLGVIDRRLDLLLPVGISFYTFQALSYAIDVYRGNICAEKNIIKYSLFVSFFPQLVAGPIERSKSLLCQIENIEKIKSWDFERIRDGLLLMFWGLFQKLVIADRAAIFVDQVYNNYVCYGFVEIAVATVLFAFQIYCDFGGYTNIARGAARVMGFELMQNFRQPYLATSIKDFWKRWHISLTSWFTDYLYIPLGGNRKGSLRKYINVFIVFAVSGLWHGASWNFIAWGILHAVFQVSGDIYSRPKKRFSSAYNAKPSFSAKLRKMLGTFILVDFAWIFFVSSSLIAALSLIRQMFSTVYTTGILNLGLSLGNWIVLLFGIAILTIVDILHEKGYSVFRLVHRQEIWFRWSLFLGLIWGTIMLGIYGIGYDANQFIYFQF